MQALINDNNSIYVTDDLPSAEARYRARFYFDPNSTTMAQNDNHLIFIAHTANGTSTGATVLQVELRYSSGKYQIRTSLLNDSTTFTNSGWITISDAPHSIELDWRASTAAGANNGGLTLWIDGAQQANVTGIDNDTRRIESVRLGAVSGIDSGTRGTYYFDAFESRRQTYVGPAAPTEMPTPIATATPTATFTPTPTGISLPDPIFADGFESGNLSAWSSSTTDNGDLSVSAAAKLIGNNGLQVQINDNNSIYVIDDGPTAEARYRARFYFDPNTIAMASNDAHLLFIGRTPNGTSAGTTVLQVEFRWSGNKYQIRAAILDDNTTFTSSGWFTISDAPHSVELDWRASTAAGANNGGLTLWIDGVQRANLTGVDNDTRRIESVQLGAVSGIDSGTRGSEYFDAFESRRQTYIGP
jgi:hypothetical protein